MASHETPETQWWSTIYVYHRCALHVFILPVNCVRHVIDILRVELDETRVRRDPILAIRLVARINYSGAAFR